MILLFVLALISLVVDCCQTLDIKNHSNLHESNPLLGPHPSDKRIIVYFFVCTILLSTAEYLLSSVETCMVSVALICLEVGAIFINNVNGCRLKFWQ